MNLPCEPLDTCIDRVPMHLMQIVISHDDMPAPAIDETIKKAKNIITDRLSNRPAPDIAVAARRHGSRA